MFKSWAPAQEGISSFEKKGPKNSCKPPEIDLTLSNHGHQSKHEYHLLKRDLRIAANPPEIDLTLSNHGHQPKNDYHRLKRDLGTAANPMKLARTAANPLKLACHFQIMGTSPNMNIIFCKETTEQPQTPLKLTCHFQITGTSPSMNLIV